MTEEKNKNIIVVIGTYNEAETIGAILDQIGQLGFGAVIVDDNSPDRTWEIVQDTISRVQSPPIYLIRRPQKLGIASAYLTGFDRALEAGADYIVQMDAGGTHDPRVIPGMIGLMSKTGADLVIGSRFLIRYKLKRLHRAGLSLGAAWLMRRLGVKAKDCTSGFRLWKADLLRDIIKVPLWSSGFSFQLELLYRAKRSGARIEEFPIDYILTNSTLNWGMVKEALRVYRKLWEIEHGN